MNRNNQRRTYERTNERRDPNERISNLTSTLLLYNIEVISLLRQMNRVTEMAFQQNTFSNEKFVLSFLFIF